MFIHETAQYKDTEFQGNVKLFRNASVSSSILGDGCSVGDDTTIERCILGNHVTVNRRSYINDSEVGDYSYSGINTTMNWAKLGRFCSLARNVDIGGFNHDYNKITTMPQFRFEQMLNGGGKIPNLDNHNSYCTIGNDVWIAAGAIILHKVKIGDGAVIGAGSIVTKDVPPYSIVAGTPARIIKYRCSDKCIERLLTLKWWELEKNDLTRIAPYLINTDITENSLDQIEKYIYNIKEATFNENA